MIFLWVPVINLNLDGTGPRIIDVDMAGQGGASSSADATRIAAANMAGRAGASSSLSADDIPAPLPPPPIQSGNGGGGGYGGHVVPRWYEPPQIIAAGPRLVDVSLAARTRARSSMDVDALVATIAPKIEARIVDIDLAARATSRSAAAGVGRIVSASMMAGARSFGYARATLALAGLARPEPLARLVGPIRRRGRATVRS